MRTIAIINQKGGTGKTTTAVNLAATLAEAGKRVLLIDIDPQRSTTIWLGIQQSDRGVFTLFNEPETTKIKDLIREASIKNLKVLPSSEWLIGAERALSSVPASETILKEALLELGPNEFDYILIDCAPTLGILAFNALAVANEVLIPVESAVMGLQGLVQMQQTIGAVKRRLNKELKICGILPCRVDNRTNHSVEVVGMLRTRFPDLIYRTEIRNNIKLTECPSTGFPITVYAPDSPGAADYRSLAIEVMAQEQLTKNEEDYAKTA